MSEIKSEKAYYIIHSNYPKYPCEGGDVGEICYETDDTVTCIDAAEQAIVQAESDARDRAIRAFIKSCPQCLDMDGNRKCMVYGREQTGCVANECNDVQTFLKAYDNE